MEDLLLSGFYKKITASTAHMKDKWWPYVRNQLLQSKVIHRSDCVEHHDHCLFKAMTLTTKCTAKTLVASLQGGGLVMFFFLCRRKRKLVHCILVQGSLLSDVRGSERGEMVNASGGRLAQEKSLLWNNAQVPQCHSLPVPITKSALKPTFCSLIHPSDPDALFIPSGSFYNLALALELFSGWVFPGRYACYYFSKVVCHGVSVH